VSAGTGGGGLGSCHVACGGCGRWSLVEGKRIKF
jgi:hypothetical protein